MHACYIYRMQTRRAQKPITIRSDRAADRLAVLTRDGRSQAKVIEEALDRMPDPEPVVRPSTTYRPRLLTADEQAQLHRIEAILAGIPPGSIMSMKEFDALEYDEDGLPR